MSQSEKPARPLRPQTTRLLTRAALMAALVYLCLLAVQYLPTGDAFLYWLAACFLLALFLLSGPLWAFLAYLTAGSLGLFTLSISVPLSFLLFYGLWVFVKMAVEWLCYRKNWPLWVAFLGKACVAALFVLAAYYLFSSLLFGSAFPALAQRLGRWLVLWPLVAWALILFYDYLLTLFRRFFLTRLEPFLKTGSL